MDSLKSLRERFWMLVNQLDPEQMTGAAKVFYLRSGAESVGTHGFLRFSPCPDKLPAQKRV